MILDHFDHTLLHFIVFNDFLFKGLRVDPFDAGRLHSVLTIRIVHQLIIQELLYEFI